jgi:hypothetical protein
MSTMRVLGRSGDKPLHWNPNDPGSVARASRAFEEYRRNRALAFSVPESGGDPMVIREFDPAADEIILTFPLIGG